MAMFPMMLFVVLSQSEDLTDEANLLQLGSKQSSQVAPTSALLSNNDPGCHHITTEEQCLQSKDGRNDPRFADSPCQWCCGEFCNTNAWNKCEPRQWLLQQSTYIGISQNGLGEGNCPMTDPAAPTLASLSNNNPGCHLFTTEEQCLQSRDGRNDRRFANSPCQWCCGESCSSDELNRCEPQQFLERQTTYKGLGKNGLGEGNCPVATTTTTTVAHPPMLDEYVCSTEVNWMPGADSQISLTDYCPTCFANPKYHQPMGKMYDSVAHVEALAKALDYCKGECNSRNCSAFFFQKHGNGHEICGFYTEAVDLNNGYKHGHQECSQVCIRKKYILGEHKTRTRRPTCPQNSSPVTSADTCAQSAASLVGNINFGGTVSQPNFAPGCYHLEAPADPSSSGIFFNDAGGDWHANTGFRGAVALVCSMDNFMTFELGAHRSRPAMETAPTCPTNTAHLSDLESCKKYAGMVGKSFNTADLPLYPRGCSDRIDHPQYSGVWWNLAEGGSWDQQEGNWWNQHEGFTGKVALVCEPTTQHVTNCDDRFAQALTAYWEYGNCGHFGNDYNKGLCGGLLAGECPEVWNKAEDSSYIMFPDAELVYPGISEEMKCVKARRKSFVKSSAFTQDRVFTPDRKGNFGEAVSLKSAGCDRNCHYLWHAQYECVETATDRVNAPPVATSWKVSNNGVTTWRPTVKEVTFYSDKECTKQLPPYTAGGALPNHICSGRRDVPVDTGCQLAVDGDITTSWRPQAHICRSGECWFGVPLDGDLPVQCVRAVGLGQGSDGENGKIWDPWNGGVILSMFHGSSWTEVARSTVGDTVVVAEN